MSMIKLGTIALVVAGCGDVVGSDLPGAIALSSNQVDEQAPAGLAIGTLSAADPRFDRFDLIDDADGSFAIVGDALQVAPGAMLDFESAASRSIVVRARDASGGEQLEELEIAIGDVREATNLADLGSGSLRQALLDAAPGELILFETGVSGTLEIASPLRIAKPITLRSTGSITLHGGFAGSMIEVAIATDVTLVDLVLDGGLGGAISNDGRLTVIHNQFSNGVTAAIANRGRLAVVDSTFRNTRLAIAANGIATAVTGSTFDGSTANGAGGAIVGGELEILNCTFSRNVAAGSGGAIALIAGTTTIAFSTFADNQASGGGGGVFVAGTAKANIRGSVFARNAATATPDIDSSANPGGLSGSGNVLANGAGTSFTSGTDNNLVGVVVALDDLRDNGGPTSTVLPAVGAAAIDHVPASSCVDLADQPLLVDQRGALRPRGGGCDSGATELP